MSGDIRFPRLLNASWQEARRLNPTAYSLELVKNDVSTAHLALAEEDEPLSVMDWVELYTFKGSAGLFRVSQRDTPASGPGGYDLRHGICCLHDSVWNNRLDANGNLLDTDYDGTVAGYMAAILSHQRTARWQLGVCADTGAYKKSGLNHDHLDTLLMELAQNRAGYLLTYDFSTSPWTVNMVACAGQVNAECRLSRNLKDGRHRQSQSGMANRLYLTIVQEEKKDTAPTTWSGGADRGQPTGNVTQDEDKVTQTGVTFRTYNDLASQAEYGVLEDTAEISLADVPDADAWAAQYFLEHAHPISQASADVYELVKETGEAWDQYDLGKWCRIVVRRDGFPADGPVEQIRYADLLSEPEKAQVELSKKPMKVSQRLSALKSAQDAAGRSGGGGGAAKATELTHWAQTVQHIEELLAGTGLKKLWETGIELDAQQGVVLYSLYNGLTSNLASISVHNEEIEALVQKTGISSLGVAETLYAKIAQNASEISSLVSKSGISALGAQETLYSLISQNAAGISSKVSAGDIASAINQTAQSVLIQAQKIDLQGIVTANQLAAEIAAFYNASTGTLSASWVTAQSAQIGSVYAGSLRVGGSSSAYDASWQSKTIAGETIYYLGR